MAANKQLSKDLVREICDQTNIELADYYRRISNGGRFYSIFPNLPLNTRYWICAEQGIEQDTYEDENDSPNNDLTEVFTQIPVRHEGHPQPAVSNSPGLPGLPNVPIGNYFDPISQQRSHNQNQHEQIPQQLPPVMEQQQSNANQAQQPNNRQPQRIGLLTHQQQLANRQRQFDIRQEQFNPRQQQGDL